MVGIPTDKTCGQLQLRIMMDIAIDIESSQNTSTLQYTLGGFQGNVALI